MLNPFKSNGIYHRYKLEQFISVLRDDGWYNSFYSNFNTTKQTVETLIKRRVLRRLIWVCAACLCPTKRVQLCYEISQSQYDEISKNGIVDVYLRLIKQ